MAWYPRTPKAKQGPRGFRKRAAVGLETRKHALRTFARKRTDTYELVSFGCDRLTLCPQTCCVAGAEACESQINYRFDVISNQQLITTWDDTVRVSKLWGELYWTPFILQGTDDCGTFATKVRQLSFLWRAMMVKQEVEGPFTTAVAGDPPPLNPLSELDYWESSGVMRRWERYHHSGQSEHFVSAGTTFGTASSIDLKFRNGANDADGTETNGTVETCCGNTSGELIEGSGLITTACQPCVGDVDLTTFGHLVGTMSHPVNSLSDCGFSTRMPRGFKQTINVRRPFTLNQRDNLSVWVNFGGLNLIGDETCFVDDTDGIEVGFVVFGNIRARIEL